MIKIKPTPLLQIVCEFMINSKVISAASHSPIANGYRKLCWAIIIFAFVARLAIRKVKF